ncbi:hypothetical protein [uncultured Nostoc sp.]|uniref:hypothetical protein n=1 Tax=uncultured Nostoc sp. TaxID=340711 RepID=UPI0035C99A9D
MPTVGNIKQVDFFIDDIPFDLKVTYFPKHFIRDKRKEMDITLEGTELSDLKKAAKKYGIPLGKNLNNDEQLLHLKSAFDVSTNQEIKEFYNKFSNLIPCLIHESIQQPHDLLRSLYKEQGSQRFDASNRLYLVLIDTNSLEDSWKIKSDCTLLKTSIDNYLDQRIFNKDKLLLTWTFKNNEYQSYADVLFVLK